MKEIHDPRHVAQLAALILSSTPDPEKHHIKKAVEAARLVLDEAHARAGEDEAAADAAQKAAEEAPAKDDTGADGKPVT